MPGCGLRKPKVLSVLNENLIVLKLQNIQVISNIKEPFSKKCDIYCNKSHVRINYAAPHKGL